MSRNRTLTELPSKNAPADSTLAALRIASTRSSIAGSIFTVALPLDTWTAGDSPKKFGSVYSRPSTSATAIVRYFQIG